MAEARATLSEPVVQDIILILTPDEAEQLARFIGKANLGVIEDRLPLASGKYHREVNDTLYRVYTAIDDVMAIEY